MPSAPYSTLHAFTAPPVNTSEYAIFGRDLPFPQTGLPWLGVAISFFLLIGIFRRRIPSTALPPLLSIAVLVTYIGTFLLSARWLDDVFVNLIHPYNLFHHHKFSTRMDSMANGTVEILYYALLTPFAGDRTLLVRANYAAGALIGLGHLIALHHLLRRVPLAARFFLLTLFAAWVPVVQSFSSGYGNGVVTLLWLIGVAGVRDDNRRTLAFVCALMPLFRPDALLYSLSLAGMYVLVHRRFTLRWWLPTLLAPVAYALLVYLLYHQWVPTPVLFKRVSLTTLVPAFPVVMPYMLSTYFLGSLERCVLIAFGALFFLIPLRREYGITRRFLGALLLSTLPILLFFYTTGLFGYNPTNYRYYAIFDMALFLSGATGIVSLLYRLRDYLVEKAASAANSRGVLHSLAFLLPALFLLLTYANISSSIRAVEGGDWLGEDIGISCTYYDLKRMDDLRFGGVYFGNIAPRGWEIASTEIDTFGFYSGREILDLWGFSNLRIARSSDLTKRGVRRDTRLFMDSNVPLFWVRTLSSNDFLYSFHDNLESNDPAAFGQGLLSIPNLSDTLQQAGPIGLTLQKYDVVRVLHGTKHISLLLVRKDLVGEFSGALVRGGATPAGQYRLLLVRQDARP